MHKFWIILTHTFINRIKTKTFLISTVLTLVLIVGFANFNKIADLFSGKEEKIAVLDGTEQLFPHLKKIAELTNDRIKLVSAEGSEKKLKKDVLNGDYEALVKVSFDQRNMPRAVIYSEKAGDSNYKNAIIQGLQQIKVDMATEKTGIDQAVINEIQTPVHVENIALDANAKTEQELNQTRGIVYAMLFLLYMLVINYGMMIAQDVANEKSSRVMEILISSVSPVTHMFAKIVGIALLGLTQIIIFAGVGYALVSAKAGEKGGMFEAFGLHDISVSIYIYAVVFFLLGYLLYATLAAMLGSLVSRVEDVQQLMTPMIFLIMIAFFIALFGLEAPDATFVTVSSFIPFFTPMIMFMRIGMLDIPLWETILSLGILCATIVLIAVVGARVYRGGVLMYGKSSSLKDFKKAIALSKKN
ncbi:ABC transporter permease [Aciduricibacillus chroicocephali]|uniref:ABC transporter permease n=1 Tax=Aciduricibacillus chroicocephali TaxID=3054939 RepID=A0ABY9KYR5_9BACI|nr:ABC transporter permease [Bacillaceae bacterium 44XB]